MRTRAYHRKIVEGHVPTRGPRQLKAEGEHSVHEGTQRIRKLRHKTIANNVTAAATAKMVIDESGDL